MNRPRRCLGARFWSKVDRRTDAECWPWLAARRNGYGAFELEGRVVYAHRLAYRLMVGPIPRGLVLDHLCRQPRCVNPRHVEPVTQRTNILRGDAPNARVRRTGRCLRGHPLPLSLPGRPRRGCRVCGAMHARAYRHARAIERSLARAA